MKRLDADRERLARMDADGYGGTTEAAHLRLNVAIRDLVSPPLLRLVAWLSARFRLNQHD